MGFRARCPRPRRAGLGRATPPEARGVVAVAPRRGPEAMGVERRRWHPDAPEATPRGGPRRGAGRAARATARGAGRWHRASHRRRHTAQPPTDTGRGQPIGVGPSSWGHAARPGYGPRSGGVERPYCHAVRRGHRHGPQRPRFQLCDFAGPE